MPQQELLKQVVQTLDLLDIDYMVTGSIASSMQGEPRLTHDIDLVVHLSAAQVPQLLQAFPQPDFSFVPLNTRCVRIVQLTAAMLPEFLGCAPGISRPRRR